MGQKYSGVKRVICVGVGGGGNCYIARFFLLLGAKVTGFDVSENDSVRDLKKLGMNFINQSIIIILKRKGQLWQSTI